MVPKSFITCYGLLLLLVCGSYRTNCASQAQVLVTAESLSKKYPLITNASNYQEKTSYGAGFGPQGRLLDGSACAWWLNAECLQPSQNLENAQCPWRYAVAVSCKRGGRNPCEIIQRFVEDLLPRDERHRLAIIVNINEKIVGFDERERKRGCEDLRELIPDESDLKLLQSYRVPILILYSQWTSYREDAVDRRLTADQVREKIYTELDTLKQQCQKGYDDRLRELRLRGDVSEGEIEQIHQKHFAEYQKALAAFNQEKEAEFDFASGVKHKLEFPFGAMRTFLVTNSESKKFLKALYGSGEVGVYLHLQDADFTDLKVLPQFYCFGQSTINGMNSEFLFKRYDALINHCYRQNSCMPVLAGGAYTYDPKERLELHNSEPAKQASLFGIELSNLQKFIIWPYGPYGVRFQEPNTMLLLHSPKNREVAGGDRFNNLLDKDDAITFGPVCEVEDFTRTLFEKCPTETLRSAMVFSPELLVATSMKSDKRGFNVPCEGTFDSKAKKFEVSSATIQESLAHINGMRQAFLMPQRWAQAVQTAFTDKKHVATRCLPSFFKCFDPYSLWVGKGVLTLAALATILCTYDRQLEEQRATIANYQAELAQHYDLETSGKMLSCAWESGQMKRLMLMNAFRFPKPETEPGMIQPKPLVEHFRRRFDYYKPNSLIISDAQQTFFNDLTITTPERLPTSPERKLYEERSKLVSEFVKAVGTVSGTQKATAQALHSSPSTIKKVSGGVVALPSMKKFLELLLPTMQDSFGLETQVFQGFQTRAKELAQPKLEQPQCQEQPKLSIPSIVPAYQPVAAASTTSVASGSTSSVSAGTSASTSSVTSGGAASSSSRNYLTVSTEVKMLVAREIANFLAARMTKKAAMEILQVYAYKTFNKILDYKEADPQNCGARDEGPRVFAKFFQTSYSDLIQKWGLTAEQIVQLKALAGIH